MVFCYYFSRSTVLKLICFFTFILEVAPRYLYHSCPNTTTFNPNSTYQNNLNTLLKSLQSSFSSNNNSSKNLFYNTTAGDNAPDRVYGLFMCRGDVTNVVCNDCVVTATQQILQRCNNEKEAYIWYDECMLRYDNKSIFSTLDDSPKVYLWNSDDVPADPDRLMQVLNNTMDNLATLAADYSSKESAIRSEKVKGFATGETNFTGSSRLYNLVQCTPDLSGDDCGGCIREAIGLLPTCCNGSQGGRVLLPSCNVRYEMYPFYGNITSAAPSPAPLPQAPSSEGNGKISAQVIIAIVGGGVVSVVLLTSGFCFLRRRAKKYDAKQESTTVGVDGDIISTLESLQYDLSTIGAATNNFSAENKVGEGGFGDVFKGTLLNGQEIAVKRLSKNSGQGVQEFKNEVILVAKLQHKNLARLLGFCLEREEKILVYEFVPNKSLDYFLFEPGKREMLDWSRRYKIIKGISLGMLYLHEDSRLKIIHRDLKPGNILLDGDMNPKISDFGMAKIFGIDQSQERTGRIIGTFGYMSPEYAFHGQFSVKSDVFSFGVLLLEIVSGKKNNNFYQSGSSENLLSYAWKCWRDGVPLKLVDPSLGESFAKNEVIRCIHIGLLCVQGDADERPTMGSVVLMFSSYSVTLPLPHQPAFFFHSSKHTMLEKIESDKSSGKSLPWSANEVSITELYPR